MQAQPHDDPVYLGFASAYDAEELYRLSSCFLPLGKIGGHPSWLDPVCIPRSEELLCKVCSAPMCFLLQVYATSEKDAAHSFHRSLFLFVCKNPACSKPNDAANMAAFRCCVPRENPWYSATEQLDPDFVTADEMPGRPSDAPALCRVCGCYAAKKCAKCGEAAYCSRDHQALDWKSGHRAACGQAGPGAEAKQEPPPNPANLFVFEEMGIEMDRENLSAYAFEDISDSEGECEEEEGGEDDRGKAEKQRYEEYLKMVKSKRLEAGGGGGGGEEIPIDDDDVEEKKDVAFVRFHRLMQLNAEQVLRYQRGGRPLLPSDKAPPMPEVDACSRCGAPRAFEMQLTPHLLAVLGVDSIGESIDWASVYIYTCSANCVTTSTAASGGDGSGMGGYAREAVYKHDFE